MIVMNLSIGTITSGGKCTLVGCSVARLQVEDVMKSCFVLYSGVAALMFITFIARIQHVAARCPGIVKVGG